jgi:ArsR family metal-binding transcriptional regulator
VSMEAGQLIRRYTLEVTTPECNPQTTSWRVNVHLEDDITEALPFLNASLETYNYYHDTKVLLWRDEGRSYAFRPHEIDIAPVENREEAQIITGKVIAMVNQIWDRRHEIVPSFEGKRPLPNLLDIYKLLPRTNCKECGYATCMAYAADLREAKAELAKCSYLFKQHNADNLVMLQGTLQPLD